MSNLEIEKQEYHLAEGEEAARAAGFKVFLPSHVAYLSRRGVILGGSASIMQDYI